jgi:hypothetical protein
LVRIQPRLSKRNPEPTPVAERNPRPASVVIVTTLGIALAVAATIAELVSWGVEPVAMVSDAVAAGSVGVGATLGTPDTTTAAGLLDLGTTTTLGVVALKSAKLVAAVRIALSRAASRAILKVWRSERPP